MNKPYFYLGAEASEQLLQYCKLHNFNRFLLVADDWTYQVAGQNIEKLLILNRCDVRTVLLDGSEVVPDETTIMKVFLQAGEGDRVLLAVGSGTITDITRFASHRMCQPFISLPTAPSVDGYASPVAALVIGGVKKTVKAQPPVAIFADLAQLVLAPRVMIAAGFGDIFGKSIALADWKLGHLLWGEPFDAIIAERTQNILQSCILAAEEIGQAQEAGVEKLMRALVDSGLCMLDFGSSHPASGAEHHMSHFLELKLLREGRPAVLHGAKVGLCSIYIARIYESLRQVSRAEVEVQLNAATVPTHESEEAKIRQVFGVIADDLIVEQAPFIGMTAQRFDRLKQQILDQWDEIQTIAQGVLTPQQMIDTLKQAGCATKPEELYLSQAEMNLALQNAHYLRNRFTICKLGQFLELS